MPQPNFSALNRTADQVKRPVQLNDGTYFGTIRDHRLDESSKKKTLFVEYTVELTHAHEDTDLQGVDDKGNEITIEPAGKKMKTTFYFTEDAEYRLKDFFESLGISTEGRTWKELLPQAIGQQVMVEVAKKPNTRGDGFFNDITKISGMANQEPEQQQVEAAQGRRRRA